MNPMNALLVNAYYEAVGWHWRDVAEAKGNTFGVCPLVHGSRRRHP